MAPSNGTGHAIHAIPTQQRREQAKIVPVLPLSYVQKRKQHEAAQQKANDPEVVQALIVTPAASPTPPPSAEDTPEKTMIMGPLVVSSSPPSIHPADDGEVPESSVEPVTLEAEETKDEEDDEVHEFTNEQSESIDDDRDEASAVSAPPSSTSHSTFHMPPPFVPASDPVSFVPANIYNGLQQHERNGMHQAHPSDGSIMFYAESNNSSPAPPPGSGNVPPYLHQQKQYVSHHGHHPSNGSHTQFPPNGYSPMGPPPVPSYNNYLRQDSYLRGPPGLDSYGPSQFSPYPDTYPSASFGSQRFAPYPSAPQSVHGSQSSAQNEPDIGTGGFSNGNNSHIDIQAYQQPRPVLPPQNTFQPSSTLDMQDGLNYYLLTAFQDEECADCILEIRYGGDTQLQVIKGHRLLFARSPILKALIQQNVHNDTRPTRLLLIPNDRFLRQDAFGVAIRRLYGEPLLDSKLSLAQDDPFSFALGYAAAGHALRFDPVFNRGIEVASSLITWENLETALDFALEGGGLPTQWYAEPVEPNEVQRFCKYGPAVNMLIYRALEFMIVNFPPDLDFDASAGEPITNRRLPSIPTASTTPDDRRRTHDPRFSLLKFGDIGEENGTNPLHSMISRILLNLPYHLLKYLFEYPDLQRAGQWGTPSGMLKVMNDVVAERDKRRVKVDSSKDIDASVKKDYFNAIRFTEVVRRDDGGIPILERYFVRY